MAVISIDTGRKEIEIIRDGESVGSIFFSPQDISILTRLKEAQENIKKIKIEGLEETSVPGETVDETERKEAETVKALAEADRIDKLVREQIDYAFGYPCSEIVFGNKYCFTPDDNGVTGVEQFLSGAMSYIETELPEAVKKANARQDKYLKRYK